MKKLFSIALLFCAMTAYAQNPAEQAALDIANSELAEPVKPKPSEFWTLNFTGNLNYGGTFLQNWAAGGDDHSHNLRAFIDANANYAKKSIYWKNRLQLDFGFLYASSTPLLQKSDDRIYLESKFGYNIAEKIFLSANYDFKSQFARGYEYKTPSGTPEGADGEFSVGQWEDARVLKSNWLAPAYTNLAIGLDWNPTKWFSMSFAPLTGGFVIVQDAQLRKAYGMAVVDDTNADYIAAKTAYEADKSAANLEKLGEFYKDSRFELGAQLKMNFNVIINDNFKFTSQVVAFTDYLMMNKKDNGYIRLNWDNRFDFTLTKYLSLNFLTNMIYDSKVLIAGKDGVEKQRVQWKEGLSIGFTYKIANK